MVKISRRNFGKLSAAGLVTTGLSISDAVAKKSDLNRPSLTSVLSREVNLPKAKNHRVIVVGGGWSGLTIAKYLKIYRPELDVILIERRSLFVSHPISGLWLAGLVNLESITFSFLDAAAHNGYFYLNASLIDLDTKSRRVFTEQGWLDYDDLILAPGVDYNYLSLGVQDPIHVQYLKTHFPAGFISASEHITIFEKIKKFKGGLFVLNAPSGIYRCSATPYERACLLASVFKREKIKGKILLIDPRDEPAVSAEGFLLAFDELYGDIIEYLPSTGISKVDPEKSIISTDFDEITFDDAAIYPSIRGSYLLEQLDLVDPKSQQMEAAIDPFTYNVLGDKHLYIAGDCRPMPFSKSGGTARSEGMYIAELIAARSLGKDIPWRSPHTICYSMVSTDPNQAVMVEGKYQFEKLTGQWAHFENYAINERNEILGNEAIDWAFEHFHDLFG